MPLIIPDLGLKSVCVLFAWNVFLRPVAPQPSALSSHFLERELPTARAQREFSNPPLPSFSTTQPELLLPCFLSVSSCNVGSVEQRLWLSLLCPWPLDQVSGVGGRV